MGNRFRRSSTIEAAPLQEETILLNPAINKFCLLNRTASFLWARLESPATAEQLAAEVCKNFSEVNLTDALRDVRSAIEHMMALDLVVAEAQAEGTTA